MKMRDFVQPRTVFAEHTTLKMHPARTAATTISSALLRAWSALSNTSSGDNNGFFPVDNEAPAVATKQSHNQWNSFSEVLFVKSNAIFVNREHPFIESI